MEGKIIEMMSLLLHPRRFWHLKSLWYDLYVANKNGNKVYIADSADCFAVHIQCIGKGNRVILRKGCFHGVDILCHGNNGTIEIEEGVVINAFPNRRTTLSVIGETALTIGTNCLISDSVTMQTSDYHKVYDTKSGILQNPDANICIGHNCWIGNRVTINKGVVISPHCVVGNCSVLTKVFDESNVVIAGNPAQIKKRNIRWSY